MPRISPRIVLTVAIAVVALAMVGVAQTRVGQRAARHLGLYAPSEPVLALSFRNPNALAQLTAGASRRPPRRVPLRFSIANLGHVAATYRWTARVGAQVRANGRTRLPAGATAQIRRSLPSGCRAPRGRSRRAGPQRVRVTVRIRRPRRSIDFWERCYG